MPTPEPVAPFHSVHYVLRVLETVFRYGNGVTDTQIARESGLPPAHLTGLLALLRREGYLERLADGAYVAGDSLALLGSDEARGRSLEAKLQRALVQLRDSLGAAVYISRYIDGEIRVTQVAAGPGTPAVTEWVAFSAAAHASAVGKCLLTQLDRDGRRDHLSRHKVARLTSRTITSERVLLSRLDSQPPTVPVLDLQEYAVGTVCAAVPLTAGSTVGALALSLPVERAHRLRAAAATLNREAAPLALTLTMESGLRGSPAAWS
ncbi:IclR family transcriptional regulator domain-containing protein [Streptomyces fuscigenes]|uniref:IclR family transcriptional regulator domain-containing protein n=1 Tax=Streptomyces fuscigenes TaxID=1528880 RepID=UPI001F250FF1|nr:IclR family transcriptional regulator C-terminal domain-containing protein [Streptomyces fuscigenes]MCF3961449.1 type IV toxin-antitoxin system AbiEi family antitoxin domain-containing protein [Streptomyces fuscigenes]